MLEIELKGLDRFEKLIHKIDKELDESIKELIDDEIRKHRQELLKSLEENHKKYLESGETDPLIVLLYDSIMKNERV